MTPLGRAISLFPALVVASALACAAWMAARPGWAPALALFGVLYGLPLAAFRLHERLFPVREGRSLLVGTGYSAWYGAHQIQLVYVAFPALEALLRLVPGLFSAWLRMWGSRVGKRVYWTPHVEIVDRNLIDVGDDVVFGHKAGIVSHVIVPQAGNLLLFVRRTKIGAGAFIGAASYLGPGVDVGEGVVVPVKTDLFPMRRLRKELAR